MPLNAQEVLKVPIGRWGISCVDVKAPQAATKDITIMQPNIHEKKRP